MLARINDEELLSSSHNKKITNQVYPFSEILIKKPVHYILVRCESVSLIYMSYIYSKSFLQVVLQKSCVLWIQQFV